MPNGDDKNYDRLCVTVDGFYARHGRWPTRVRLGQDELDNLRDELFSPKRWARIASKLEFTAETDVGFIASASDRDESFNYREPHDADFPRVKGWLGEPDFPSHAPRFKERACFTVAGGPVDYPGGPRWREYYREEATAHLERAQLRHVEREVKIDVWFYLPPSSHARDIDNMVKNLVDALGAAGLFKPSRGGGHKTPWNTDDHWLCRIDAEKHDDAERPRCEVVVWVREER
jgi:hypothetical protein